MKRVLHDQVASMQFRSDAHHRSVQAVLEDPKLSSVKAAIDVTTLITGDPQRDEPVVGRHNPQDDTRKNDQKNDRAHVRSLIV